MPASFKQPKHNWRKIFFLCWWRQKNGYSFNIVIFLADIYLWILIGILLYNGISWAVHFPWIEILNHALNPNPLQGI